ncbi:hypothetical protein V6N11_042478 [Hibiscus sabdariffa]|uniref:S-locus glycoprotein n=1 Tax=Hibiscus sabdariffa TaxID=183260 RepID=A0ABR2QWU5_9ROSI
MASDTISPSESLTDGMTLVSNGGTFALGFFSTGTSENRYLGIWYNNIPMQTVVWVANRVSPINDSTGLLKIETSARIVLQVQNTTAVWSTNTTASARNPVLQLLDSGNLVVRDGEDSNPENYLWQSFDYPTDTMLPGMKIGVDLRTGIDRRLSAWKNWGDPSPGDLVYGVELEGSPEMVLWKGLQKYSRSGLWTGNGFSGAPNSELSWIFHYKFVWNENEVYYIYFLKNNSVRSRVVLNQTDSARERYTWNPVTQTWQQTIVIPIDYCDRYERCGPNGICDSNNLPAYCQCLIGFMPKWPERWNSSDYSAWRLWKEDKPLVLAGDFLVETDYLSELLRCIHIGLLCVQQHPEERPNMSSVVVMLVSRNELPTPKQPGFLFYNKPFEADCSSGHDGPSSRNEISLSVLEAR